MDLRFLQCFLQKILMLCIAPGWHYGWQRGLAVSYGKIADVAARKGARAEALDGFRRARDIVARLSRESPDNATLQNDLKFYEHQIAQQNGP